MTHLVHTAHAQLVALWLGFVGWTLTAVALGLIQWRVWLVSDTEVISSGVAWVGLWRACFISHTLATPGFIGLYCRYISLTDAFTPPELAAGQVLMLLSLAVGLCGTAGGLYALRNAYFGMDKNPPIRLVFVTTGMLYLLAAGMSFTPLLWNMSMVVTNQTIHFPPDFRLPRAPDSQHVGCGIGVGVVGAVLMAVCGVIFCVYRLPARSTPVTHSHGALTRSGGKENPAFEIHERL